MAREDVSIISAAISTETLQLLDENLSGKGPLSALVENGIPVSKTGLIRAGLLFFFENIDEISKNPDLYYRALTAQSMEHSLLNILEGSKR